MYRDFQPFRLQPPDCSADRFLTLPLSVDDVRSIPVLGFALRAEARQTIRPNRVHFRCGPVVRLTMLPTPPHGDAVSFGYRTENVSLERTCTSRSWYTRQRTLLWPSAIQPRRAGTPGPSVPPTTVGVLLNRYNPHGTRLRVARVCLPAHPTRLRAAGTQARINIWKARIGALISGQILRGR